MYNVIQKYMQNLTIDKLNMLCNKNNVFMSSDELSFSYNFIMKNWEIILSNPQSFNIDKYKDNFTSENFIKIKNLYKYFYAKYSNYL